MDGADGAASPLGIDATAARASGERPIKTPDPFVFPLDLTDDEARTLLLSLDPLAELAETQEQIHDRLRELTQAPSPELEALWQSTSAGCCAPAPDPKAVPPFPEQFLVMVTCRDEKEQVELLGRFQREGLECRALVG